MGDRLKQSPLVRKKKKDGGLRPVWDDGHVSGQVLYLPGNRVLMVLWHRFTKIALASWCLSSQDYLALWQEWECDPMSKFLRNVKAAKTMGKDSPVAANDKEFAKTHPAIHEFLTLKKDDAGVSRQTSTLYIFCEDGQFKVCLAERDEELSLWASAEGLAEVLEALEAMLQTASPPWRKKGGRQKKKND